MDESSTTHGYSWQIRALIRPIEQKIKGEGRKTFLFSLAAASGVKDIGLPESLHPTTNARRYMVAAGVAETATWDPCVELPSPAASRQLRDELLVGSSSVGGPWGSGPRWLRPSGPRGRGPPAGWAPLAGRQPGSTDYLDTETLIHGLSARRFLFMSGFFIVLLDRERSKVV